MTNLPIASNNIASPVKAEQGGASPLRNDASETARKASATSPANSAAHDQTEEPFAVVLERQISDAAPPAMNTSQVPDAYSGNSADSKANQIAKDGQDQSALSTNTASDLTNSLAAMLLQIPLRQDTVSKAAPEGDSPLPTGEFSRNGKIISSPTKGNDKLKTGIEKSLQLESREITDADKNQLNDSSPIIALSSEMLKQTELAGNLTSQSRIGQNLTNAGNSMSAIADMPNMSARNISEGNLQTVTTPLGNQGWGDDFSQKIIWMSTQQNQIAELHLNPPDLGPLNVLLKINDNQLTAQFTSPHSAVREAVENALPKLRELLADNSIMLGNATVSDQTPRDRGAEGFMKQGSRMAGHHEASYGIAASDDVSSTTVQSVAMRRHNGILDTYA